MKVNTLKSCVSKLVRHMGGTYAALVACAILGSAGSGAHPSLAQAAPGSPDGAIRICIVVPHFKDEYWLSVAYGLQLEAKRTGAELWTFESGGYHALARQLELLDVCRERQAEAILLGAVSANDPKILSAVASLSETIPVLALVNELRSPSLAGAVGVNWQEMGGHIGAFLFDRHPAGTEPATAVLISGPAKSGWAPLVETGLLAAIEGSAVRVVDIRRADTGLREQMREVEDALADHPEVDYVIGTAPAVEAAMGLLNGSAQADRPALVATYISHSIRRGMGNGSVLAVPFDNPILQGQLGVRMAIDATRGRTWTELVGPEIKLLVASEVPNQQISLSPAGFLPTIE
ncbi:TMAO reductase system periplasmic protein TorT [Aliiruegeria lutimaris]|uniref:Monosaccharide ABC transporter substrate-binding protein, CUT2 family n=1 Tax=Aliiruegeria lutimaris TaxID=571298 RepID=A0A1G9JC08_9RHOB|nr:TMAO reductase system periplasmic protein TorT [Aliiruegeria lutimaris]SDL34745.1 monosaccharide ABC transporter substrate-binding protein, CUT2 family [Aliiruegeria lutimaris]